MRRTLLSLFMGLAILLCAVASANGATVVLPYLNSETFSTSAVVVNPTGATVTLDGFWDAYGIGAPPPSIPPFSVFRAADYPHHGGGVYTLNLPDGCSAYSELRYPNGMRVRYEPLPPLTPELDTRTIYDVLTDGADYKSYLYFAAPSGGVFTARSYAADGTLLATDSYLLYAGTDPQIVPVAAGTAKIVLTYGIAVGGGAIPQGPIYSFSLISHQPEGQVIVTYPVGFFLTGMP